MAASRQDRYLTINDFIKLERLGEGTYGTVFKVRNKKTGECSALKQIKLQGGEGEEGIPSCAVREISFLKKLDHPNVIKLQNIVPDEGLLFLLFDLMHEDLRKYINRVTGKGDKIPLETVNSYSFQILQGLNYCHKRRLLHRDLKPQNILLDERGGLKLGDFGLARLFGTPTRITTYEVSTLWYRAPELLLEFGDYSSEIDLWSVGCVIGEMVKGSPVFKGENGVDQVRSIFKILGTPRESSWPGVSQSLIYQELSYSVDQETTLEEVLNTDSCLLELIAKLFTMCPKKRISAEEALNHQYFTHIQAMEVSEGLNLATG